MDMNKIECPGCSEAVTLTGSTTILCCHCDFEVKLTDILAAVAEGHVQLDSATLSTYLWEACERLWELP